MTDIELTLPESARRLVAQASSIWINPGLQIDKLSCGGDQQAQGKALASVARCPGDGELLAELLARREAALADLGAVRLQGRTVGPLTLHLSRSGALENAGIALHPVYGFAWLPGTGLKGLTRAWAETVWAPEQVDRVAAWNKIRAVFGTSPQSDRKKNWLPDDLSPPAEDSVGRIVFHDAWPTNWPKLVRDIVNNHHSKYYQGNGKEYPGDWEDPVPVNFLAVAEGTRFDFAVSDRARAEDGLAQQARDWLRSALTHAGAGAKTAAGYGRIVPVEGDRPSAPRSLLRSEHRLKLVTPAFLAGAEQGESDCDLRPATLRGLLRWWWRTMHAGHLLSAELAKLESLVWGNTETGSAVSIALEPLDSTHPKPYRKDRIQGLSKPRNKRLIQGLYYASYGMDETAKGKRKSRWYREAGNRWNLVLSARKSYSEHREVPAQLLLEQAEAALWLLARFGGIGSKSRKGFGSLGVEGVQSIQSVQDCLRAAKRIRDQCGLPTRESVERSGSPALECRIGTEIPTHWDDPWPALDRVGTVYQEFVKELEPKRDRRALGLPRSIGKPRQQLRASGDIDRHASPVHWSLHQTAKGLVVRFVAFPAARLPDWDKSRSILERLKASADSKLRKNVGQGSPRAGQSPRIRVAPSQEDAVSARPGSRVRAVLLEERTKKGGWKARTADGQLSGHISNSTSVPTDRKSGDEVELVVTSAKPTEAIFRWPLAITESPSGNRESTRAATRRSADRGRRWKR